MLAGILQAAYQVKKSAVLQQVMSAWQYGRWNKIIILKKKNRCRKKVTKKTFYTLRYCKLTLYLHSYNILFLNIGDFCLFVLKQRLKWLCYYESAWYYTNQEPSRYSHV
jgi:hypothetical protein